MIDLWNKKGTLINDLFPCLIGFTSST